MNKFNVMSDSNKLTSQTVYINVCGKYKEMNTMASRTLLVNPKAEQKNSYILLNEVLDVCINSLSVGNRINQAYMEAKKYLEGKDASLASKLHSNFGFGVI